MTSYFQVMIRIPAKIKSAPKATLGVKGSLSNRNDKASVISMLALSIIATYDTGPSFRAR